MGNATTPVNAHTTRRITATSIHTFSLSSLLIFFYIIYFRRTISLSFLFSSVISYSRLWMKRIWRIRGSHPYGTGPSIVSCAAILRGLIKYICLWEEEWKQGSGKEMRGRSQQHHTTGHSIDPALMPYLHTAWRASSCASIITSPTLCWQLVQRAYAWPDEEQVYPCPGP